MLTDAQCQRPNSWRCKYRITGREKVLTIGSYPNTSLALARTARENARKLLRDGNDPSQSKRNSDDSFEMTTRQ